MLTQEELFDIFIDSFRGNSDFVLKPQKQEEADDKTEQPKEDTDNK